MQTFLPYPDFVHSAHVLDNKRLGKQRVEVLQILRTLAGETKGWRNHPAVRMWRGYEQPLIAYGIRICEEWIGRGFRDTTCDKIQAYIKEFWRDLFLPVWFGDEAFHASHRAALLAKDPEWYGQWGWSEEPVIDYVWPV